MLLDKLARLRAPDRNRRWIVFSAAIHLAVLVALLLYPVRRRPVVQYVDIGEGRETPMPAFGGAGNGTAAPHAPPPATPSVPAPTAIASLPAPQPASAAAVPNEADSLPVDTHRLLGPDYGDGRLWVRPGDAAEGRLPGHAEVSSVARHVAKVDSALAAKIRAYLDTVPPDSFATRPAPSWTTQIAGKTWGIDGKWIYLGGVKIPTMVLAFLPLPQGNYEQSKQAQQLQLWRRDIMEAAARAENSADFKRYVKELRQRKEEEHEGRRPPPAQPPVAQQPDTSKRAPLIP